MNVQAKDANGQAVPVYEARFNNLGDVESIFIKDGSKMRWAHAHEFDVTVTEGDQTLPEQAEIMTKDTQLKGQAVRVKSADAEAEAADNANDVSAADQPAPKRIRRVRKEQPISELETVAPGGDFEPILDDSLVPDEPVPTEITKPADEADTATK